MSLYPQPLEGWDRRITSSWPTWPIKNIHGQLGSKALSQKKKKVRVCKYSSVVESFSMLCKILGWIPVLQTRKRKGVWGYNLVRRALNQYAMSGVWSPTLHKTCLIKRKHQCFSKPFLKDLFPCPMRFLLNKLSSTDHTVTYSILLS